MPTKTTKKKPKGGGRIRPLYGVPIYDAIKRGDPEEMETLRAEARKHIKEVKTALATLEKKIGS